MVSLHILGLGGPTFTIQGGRKKVQEHMLSGSSRLDGCLSTQGLLSSRAGEYWSEELSHSGNHCRAWSCPRRVSGDLGCGMSVNGLEKSLNRVGLHHRDCVFAALTLIRMNSFFIDSLFRSWGKGCCKCRSSEGPNRSRSQGRTLDCKWYIADTSRRA